MNRPTRYWTRLCLMGLAAILMASGALFLARRRASLQGETLSFTPLTGEAEWDGDWELSTRGADPSQAGSLANTDRVTIPFNGTALALRVRRSDYRAYLWVSVDGEPANQLPQTERGAYLVLSSPDYEPQTDTILVAAGLEDGAHTAEIVADRGWDQWPLVGWQVRRGPALAPYDRALAALTAAAVVCLAALAAATIRRGRNWKSDDLRVGEVKEGQFGLRRLNWLFGLSESPLCSPASFLITAGLFYVSPWLPLTLVAGAAMAILVLLRLDLGLAMVALSAPFYLHPRPLLGKSFSMTEILILLCLGSWAVRRIGARTPLRFRSWLSSSPDLAVLFLVLAATASTLFAERRHVALRELRVVILEPALFYLMIRTTELPEKATWRIVDGFVAGAVLVSLIGVIQYAMGINVITAEQGFRRLRSVYGSPNNAALYLGRALPVLLAVASFARRRARRIAYGVFVIPVALALLLSFSRAAILIGVPFALLVLGLLAGGRWRWMALGLIAGAAIAVVPLLRTPRFAGLLDPRSGTLFFRLQLWQASWRMFTDHPWLGVGPDNFLYQYRGRYILPTAWQEPHLSHAHNIVLTYATRLGLPGLAAGLWLLMGFWKHGLPLRRNGDRDLRALALGLMGSMAYGLAHGLVDASYFFVDLALTFLLALGLVQSVRRYRTHEWKN